MLVIRLMHCLKLHSVADRIAARPKSPTALKVEFGSGDGLSTADARAWTASSLRGPKDHKKIRFLQTMISGIPVMLGLGTGMSDPYVYVVYRAPTPQLLGRAVRHHLALSQK